MNIKLKKYRRDALFFKALFFFTYFFFVTSLIGFSQLQVANKSSRQPIPYVTVSNLNKDWGTYTNEKGVFTISGNFESEILELRRLGYETIKIKIDTINTVIYMTESEVALKEVVVSSHYASNKQITLKSSKRNKSISSIALYGGELITEFTKPDKLNYLKEVIFRIRPILNHNHPKVRIKIYTSNQASFFNRTKPVIDTIYVAPERSKSLSLDLSFKPLVLQKKYIFVGIEWLNKAESNEIVEPQLFYTISKANKNTALFSMWGGNWSQLNKLTGIEGSSPIIYIKLE